MSTASRRSLKYYYVTLQRTCTFYIWLLVSYSLPLGVIMSGKLMPSTPGSRCSATESSVPYRFTPLKASREKLRYGRS